MKKVFSVLMIMLCSIMFVSCGKTTLSENYNEDDLKTRSEKYVTLLNEGKYSEICDDLVDALKTEESEAAIKDVYETLVTQKGEFVEINNFKAGQEGELAVTISTMKFEKGNVDLILKFNEEFKLETFLFK